MTPTDRPGVSGPHHKSTTVSTVVADLQAGRIPDRRTLADAVRTLLKALAEVAPGRAVEVRVPPHGAAQCTAGPRHARGTPPNVVEMDPVTWVRVATGDMPWARAVAEGKIHASGPRADISCYLPLQR